MRKMMRGIFSERDFPHYFFIYYIWTGLCFSRTWCHWHPSFALGWLKSLSFFHTNHMLGTLDFTGFRALNSFQFSRLQPCMEDHLSDFTRKRFPAEFLHICDTKILWSWSFPPFPFVSPMVQFQLLHSKFPLCSSSTRGLLMSTYIKFINLFPEIKGHIQEVRATSLDQLLIRYCRF